MLQQGDRGKTGDPGPPGEPGPMVRSKSGPCLSHQGGIQFYISKGWGCDVFGETDLRDQTIIIQYGEGKYPSSDVTNLKVDHQLSDRMII